MKKIVIVLVVIFLGSVLYLQMQKKPYIGWSAWVYTEFDNGLEYSSVGDFKTETECIDAGRTALKAGRKLKISNCPGECLADRIICGENCEIAMVKKGVSIADIKCRQRLFIKNSTNPPVEEK